MKQLTINSNLRGAPCKIVFIILSAILRKCQMKYIYKLRIAIYVLFSESIYVAKQTTFLSDYILFLVSLVDVGAYIF